MDLHLFGDIHMDLNGIEKTTQQVENLHAFVKDLPPSKEVIVEDRPTLVAEAEEKTTIEQWLNWVKEMPSGNRYALVNITPLCYAALGYSLSNIPTYNCEVRYTPTSLKKSITEIMQYNDHPILNAYYQNVIEKYKTTNKALELRDARILHRLYHNSNKDYKAQVIIAGSAHIENIIPIIEQLGYQKIAQLGINLQELTKIEKEYIEKILDKKFELAKKNNRYTTSRRIKGEIDTIYQSLFNTITADLSNLTEVSQKALADYETNKNTIYLKNKGVL